MYYAIYNQYGIGTVSAHTGLPYGVVYAFDTKQERDAWIDDNEDYYNGNEHTEPISSKVARRMMVRELRSEYDVHDASWMSVKELVSRVECERVNDYC